MALLEQLIRSGRIVDIMLAFVVVEVVILLALWHRKGRGVPPRALLLNVGAGGSLMLALGAVLKGFGTAAIAACLVLALVFHLADLLSRWRSQ
ncbi:MAG: hypothetical protein AAF465_02435 [Pseudomonadota bacterium]